MIDIKELLRRCHEGPDVPMVSELEAALRQAVDALARLQQELDAPKGDRLLLNAYGRKCYDAGTASMQATVERLTAELEEARVRIEQMKLINEGQSVYCDRLTAALRAVRHILMEEIETYEDPQGSLLTPENYNKIWEDTGPAGKPNSVVGILDTALAPADLETHCDNQSCECHTNPARAVVTPFPLGLGPPSCCSRCARTGGSV